VENRTIKEDWYNDLLGNTSDGFVSGHATFTQKLNLKEGEHCALRFVHREETLLIFLTIETADATAFSNQVLQNYQFKKLQALFGEHLYVLAFDAADHFKMAKPGSATLDAHTSDTLEAFIAGIDPALVENKGTYKTINRSVNDAFQAWTRTHLTRNCVVNDLDALLIGKDAQTVCELKRVKAALTDWKPYLDDYHNYKSFFFIAKEFKLQARVIAYQANNDQAVAFHFNIQLALDQSAITGNWILLQPRFTLFARLGFMYRSSNSRR